MCPDWVAQLVGVPSHEPKRVSSFDSWCLVGHVQVRGWGGEEPVSLSFLSPPLSSLSKINKHIGVGGWMGTSLVSTPRMPTPASGIPRGVKFGILLGLGHQYLKWQDIVGGSMLFIYISFEVSDL